MAKNSAESGGESVGAAVVNARFFDDFRCGEPWDGRKRVQDGNHGGRRNHSDDVVDRDAGGYAQEFERLGIAAVLSKLEDP